MSATSESELTNLKLSQQAILNAVNVLMFLIANSTILSMFLMLQIQPFRHNIFRFLSISAISFTCAKSFLIYSHQSLLGID